MDWQDVLLNVPPVLLIIAIIVIIGFIQQAMETIDYFRKKGKCYFQSQEEQENQSKDIKEVQNNIAALNIDKQTIDEKMDNFQLMLDKLDSYMEINEKYHQQMEENWGKVDNNLELINTRLQDNIRTYIVDKHHYYKYKIGAIDDFNLECIERSYLYYKQAGGDSFIDQLMDELRKLPRVVFDDVEASHQIKEYVKKD